MGGPVPQYGAHLFVFVIEAERLTRTFGPVHAVGGLTFSVKVGGVITLVVYAWQEHDRALQAGTPAKLAD